MTQKINIYSDEWCDMVFAEKNQEYGAFELRKNSSSRHGRAALIAVVFFTLAVSSPVIIKSIIPEKKEKVVEVANLSKLNVENTKPKEENQLKDNTPPPELKSTIKFTPPVIKPDEEVKDEEMPKTQDEINKTTTQISVQDIKGKDDGTGVDIKDLNQNQEIVEETEKPFTIVEQMPDYPGGIDELNKFLKENIKYPQMARESGIEGTVYVTFVVSKSGKISNVKVLRGIGGGCDEEAIRVVGSMPGWIPGKQNGVAVPVQFNLPIKFILK